MHAAECLVPWAGVCLIHNSQVGADVPNTPPRWRPGRPGGAPCWLICGVAMVTLELLHKALLLAPCLAHV